MGRAHALFAASAPLSPHVHLFGQGGDPHLLVADGDRVFRVESDVFARFAAAQGDDAAVAELLRDLGLASDRPFVDDIPVSAPPVRALSLAVAQKCNLGCTYCY